MKKEYLLIDNVSKLDVFMRSFKERYIPIVTEYYLVNYLKARDIHAIGIYDCLPSDEIKEVRGKANLLADNYLRELDNINKTVYQKIFKTDDVRFFSHVIGVYCKRVIMNCLLFARCMEAIIAKHQIQTLFYLDGGIVCLSSSQKIFSVPDDIFRRVLQAYHGCLCKLNYIKIEPMHLKKSPKRKYSVAANVLRAIRIWQARLISLSGYFRLRKKMLVLYPLSGLSLLMDSFRLNRKLEVILWNPGNEMFPQMSRKINQKLHARVKNRFGRLKAEEAAELFSFDVPELECKTFLGDFDFNGFIIPLLKKFVDENLPEIVSFWGITSGLHALEKIDLLAWGNSPIRFPGA